MFATLQRCQCPNSHTLDRHMWFWSFFTQSWQNNPEDQPVTYSGLWKRRGVTIRPQSAANAWVAAFPRPVDKVMATSSSSSSTTAAAAVTVRSFAIVAPGRTTKLSFDYFTFHPTLKHSFLNFYENYYRHRQ